MKSIFIILITLSFLYADEIRRLEAIIVEITQLRTNYEECKAELLESKKDTTNSQYDMLKDKVKKLEKLVKKQDELLKTKESMLKNKHILDNKCKEEDGFPQLKMKPEHKKEVIKKQTKTTFKPSTFHLNQDSTIHDAIGGKEIDKWEKNTSFTSGVKTDDWIKISGYFVDKKWRKSKKEMWIKLKYVSKKFERR